LNIRSIAELEALSRLKAFLKSARYSQPFNAVATSVAKAIRDATGAELPLLVKHLHRAGIVSSRLPNGKLLRLYSAGGDDGISNLVYWNGWRGYEPETSPLFYEIASRSRTVLDIGAHVGFYTLLAAHASHSARVFAFEPIPTNYERLCTNVALNRTDRIVPVNAAVGCAAGEAQFLVRAGSLPLNPYVTLDETDPDVRRITVPVLSVDQFARSTGVQHVDLVKIDTESTEHLVLRGMTETLARDRPTLICEVLPEWSCPEVIESVLFPLGYRDYLVTPEGPMPQARIVGHEVYLNHLLVPQERALLGS
jgi:FkbM family methyltransferase